jgi:hypothetical protein
LKRLLIRCNYCENVGEGGRSVVSIYEGVIVERTMKILGGNTNVMDREGDIIGSGDKERISHVHEGALFVLKEELLWIFK